MNAKNKAFAIGTLGFSLLSGIGDVYSDSIHSADIFYITTLVIYALLALTWYILDVAELERERSLLLQIFIIVVPVLGILTHLLLSRETGGKLKPTLWFLFFVVGCVVLNAVGAAIGILLV